MSAPKSKADLPVLPRYLAGPVPAFLDTMLGLVRERGLRSLSLTALCFLDKLSAGSATMTELALRAKVSVSAVSPQLSALGKLGLVERISPEFGDLRERVWRLTGLGVRTLEGNAEDKSQGPG